MRNSGIMFTNPHGNLPSEKVSNSRKDHKEEENGYDIHAIGDYDVLVGHIQIEISSLIDYFLKESYKNYA